MTVTAQSPWRTLGDTTLATYQSEFARKNSPLLPFAADIFAAVRGYSALYLAHLGHESEYATTGIASQHPEWHNAVGTKVRGGNNQYQQFASWADGATEWRNRVLDPAYAYAPTTTIASYVHVYAPSSDGNNEAVYVAYIIDTANRFAVTTPTQAAGGTTVTTLTFGRVPMPKITNRQSVTANKPEGVGWNNLGKRTPKFLVIHRMEGNLQGTDQYFAMASTGALTDYGIGTAGIDGSNNDGTIMQWNDPRGYRAGWASGPVSAPYGDGLAWLNWGYAHGYDVNFVNICGVSVEHSGDYNDPFSDVAFAQSAALVAYWFDQFQVPYDKAPIGPDGISCITWHQEWTIGTGKICPGPWLMNQTQALIDAAAKIMQPYQTGEAGTPENPPSTPVAVPTATYAKPDPIAALAAFGAANADDAKALVSVDGTNFVWVYDQVKVTKETKRLQHADAKSAPVGPPLKVGEEFTALWLFTAKDGKPYYYTTYATRVAKDDTERIADDPAKAA